MSIRGASTGVCLCGQLLPGLLGAHGHAREPAVLIARKVMSSSLLRGALTSLSSCGHAFIRQSFNWILRCSCSSSYVAGRNSSCDLSSFLESSGVILVKKVVELKGAVLR